MGQLKVAAAATAHVPVQPVTLQASSPRLQSPGELHHIGDQYRCPPMPSCWPVRLYAISSHLHVHAMLLCVLKPFQVFHSIYRRQI